MKMNRKLAVFGLTVATSAMLFGSCSTIQNTNNTTKGGVIGGVAGGALGALIGGKAGNTAIGTLAGAAIGGAAGVLIGKKMDKQAAEISKTVEGAEVTQSAEGIVVKFDSGILFDFNKSDLKTSAKDNIANLVATLNKEQGTEILVIGHTDNVGTLAANDKVSLDRANSVRAFAVSKGLSSSRIKTEGRNFSEPIASNDTESGRAQNRRVEIVIVAGDQMKKEAKQQANQ
ncbi:MULTISPECIES: OmpA family protein [Sphingobacterium]|uniref:Outer membrane protein OmpA-like peptidoglycan-associated protein n=2 Tax=Sphingobacterium detergens TaxID=1145106 RepID=A0A420AG89_SPHD1|nr:MULTISPECIES: OmpA family protein [Sphingobacterium]MCS4228458.1 outer membrane protein OmpA-like peptidoglycan-associated protein [Sphingobacterium sp. BIGb0165]RKE43449.1 outer membrane protein OmpA-like peptidoglycan-associated protein [Sphingobacterium detergens]